ncbi:hypothetical protein B0H13DRAFT_2661985 [Mycena leptocephala]|nr:hypothetical protein B0H13DRAFT_2661985 [Mycena leptocephala]
MLAWLLFAYTDFHPNLLLCAPCCAFSHRSSSTICGCFFTSASCTPAQTGAFPSPILPPVHASVTQSFACSACWSASLHQRPASLDDLSLHNTTRSSRSCRSSQSLVWQYLPVTGAGPRVVQRHTPIGLAFVFATPSSACATRPRR